MKVIRIEDFLIHTSGFRQNIKPSVLSQSFEITKVEGMFASKKRSRRGRHDSKRKGRFLRGNVGQAVVQYGRSVDHGISGSLVSYSRISL